MTAVRENENLRAWIVFVYGDDRCTCDYLWKSLGRGYGKGWVRLTTEPGCPKHAPD